ncbi:MAG: hypothetical protein IPG52_17245 [Rhodocyclaceae bacterium]|nr:hypothetical protein [Rhodocyclaceae bacterium]
MQNDSSASTTMTPGKGLLVLGVIVIVIGSFLALTHTLAIHNVWAAFLFLLYWAGIEHASFEKLLPCVVGATLGLLMGFLLKMLPAWLGDSGIIVFLAAVLVLVYLQVMNWLATAVNMVTMLFLTVTTIPAIQSGVDFADAAVALAVGIVFFAALVWAGTAWQQRRQPAV